MRVCCAKNMMMVPEHCNNGQSGFENADVYLVTDAESEKHLSTVCFTEDKTEWAINSDLGLQAEDEIVAFIKSQSPLTAL